MLLILVMGGSNIMKTLWKDLDDFWTESPVKSIFTHTSLQSFLAALKPASCSFLKMAFLRNAATFYSYKIGETFLSLFQICTYLEIIFMNSKMIVIRSIILFNGKLWLWHWTLYQSTCIFLKTPRGVDNNFPTAMDRIVSPKIHVASLTLNVTVFGERIS